MLRTLQTNLTGGAVSDDAKDRLDLAVWRNSVRRAENVQIRPQGGATRRLGQKVLGILNAGLSYQVEPFVFSQNQSYVCLFRHAAADIWNRVTRSFVITVAGSWTEAMIANNELVIVQSFDTMFVFHKDFETQQILRTGASTFTIGPVIWGYYDNADGAGALQRMPMQKFVGGNSTLTASALVGAGVVITSNVDIFNPAHVGTWVQFNQIMCFVTGYTDPQHVTVTIPGTATLTTLGPTVDWQEQAFSAVRGWARCGCLHEQRLWIGGGRDIPNTIFGSTTFDPLNFWLGGGQPTDAIKYTAAADRVAEIKRMVSFRHLQVFTADGEFYAPSPQQSALTPANFSLKQQSSYGIANAPALRFDQTTIFISRTANAIREFVFDDLQQSYTSDALTFMAKDFIRSPIDISVAIEISTAQEAMAIVTNGDGSLAVLSKVRKENVGGWMTWTTQGSFKSIGIVEREIWSVCAHHSANERLLAVFDPLYRLDFGAKLIAGTPTAAWGPFPLHVGRTVHALAGNLYLGTYVVSGAGFIELETEVSEIEIGYAALPLVQPLVQEVQMPDGVSWAQPKRNVSVTIQLVDTYSAKINDDLLPTDNAEGDPGIAPDPFTGKFKSWMLGVSAEQAPIITAPLPLPFHVTAILTEVEV